MYVQLRSAFGAAPASNRLTLAHAVARWQAQRKTQGRTLPVAPGLAGLGNGSVQIRDKEVKKLLSARGPDAAALVAKVPIPCRLAKGECVATPVRRATIGAEEHVWTLAVTGDIGQLSKVGMSAPLLVPGVTVVLPPLKTTTRGKTVVTHRTLIFVNPLRLTFGWPDLKKKIPNKQKRVEFSFAASLYHELIHALIAIERAMPPGSPRSGLVVDFEHTLRVAHSATLSPERQAVKNRLTTLMTLTGTPKAQLATEVDKQFFFLINEKFADQTSGTAFGRPVSNASTAKSYGGEVAHRIESAGTPFPDRRGWAIRVADLVTDVTALYDGIDRRPLPEIVPRPGHVAPIIQTEPAITTLR
jgi:hypothetical protein